MPKIFNKTVIFLALIVLLAGTLRILRMIEEDRFSVDAYLYFQMAEDWAYYGTDYVTLHNYKNIPPMLPWLMAVGYSWGLKAGTTGLILGILLNSLMPLSAFWITLNLFPASGKYEGIQPEANALPLNHIYALLAAFLVAVHPFLVRISVSCLREILYLPLITLAVAFAISAIYNKSLWKWCIFALLTALANVARREGISLIFIFFVWLAVELINDRKSFIGEIKYYAATSLIIVLSFSGLTLLILYTLRSASYIWHPFHINID